MVTNKSVKQIACSNAMITKLDEVAEKSPQKQL
jgi:hypothetical protein